MLNVGVVHPFISRMCLNLQPRGSKDKYELLHRSLLPCGQHHDHFSAPLLFPAALDAIALPLQMALRGWRQFCFQPITGENRSQQRGVWDHAATCKRRSERRITVGLFDCCDRGRNMALARMMWIFREVTNNQFHDKIHTSYLPDRR